MQFIEMRMFEYHILLHHSQTNGETLHNDSSLSTIYFYIILKQQIRKDTGAGSLSTIYFYIILKQRSNRSVKNAV